MRAGSGTGDASDRRADSIGWADETYDRRVWGSVAESITIIDNRNGESLEIPFEHGGISAAQWSKLLPGVWFYDPGFVSTAACESSITYLDGDEGILRYRGYPIEQLAESSTYLEVAYLLLNGELPTTDQYEVWEREITLHTFIHENVRKRFLEGFHYDAHPMGMLVSAVAALSTFYGDAKDIFDVESRDKQIIRLIAKMPTLAAAAHRFSVGMPFVYPDNSLPFTSNFLSMMWKIAEPRFEADPDPGPGPRRALHPPRRPRAELLDHRHAGGRLLARRSLFGLRRRRRRPVRTPARRGQRGGHPDAHRHRHVGQRRALHRLGQGRIGRTAAGLRPPGLQELRPEGDDHQEDGRRGVHRHRQEPAVGHRPQAGGDRPLRRLLPVPEALSQRGLLLRD